MKLTVAVATLLFYSIFAFIFTAVFPAICLGFGPGTICSVVCDSEPKAKASCCSESCAMACEETEPITICLGAYGTQNSLRTDCSCPAPAKTPATFESYRLLKDFSQIGSSIIADDIRPSDITRDILPESRPFLIHSEIISTTVLRI
ncbi:MAG: hypothetical protein WBP29_00350 [Candidatus Zixiibacteriota bacterium]